MMDDFWIYQAYDVFASYDTGIKIDYVLIYLLGAWYTLYFARKIGNAPNNKKWWKYATVYALFFSIIEGCRYLRGTDYLNYGLYYKYSIEGNATELIYNFFQAIFHKLQIPFYGVLFFYALCWIVCLLLWCKGNRKLSLAYLLPVSLVFSWQSFECFVRQSFAFSFVFMFLSYLLAGKYKHALLFAFIAVFIHNASALFILIILGIYTMRNRLLDVRIYIVVYLLAVFLLNMQFLPIIQKVTSYIPFIGDSFFGRYLTQANNWFSSDAAKDSYSRGFVSNVIVAIFDISVMYLCYVHQRKDNAKDVTFYYNLFCITNIFLQLSFNFEIIRRIFIMFYMFSAYLVAYIMSTKAIRKNESYLRLYIKVFVMVYFVKTILLASNQLLIWDASGKYYFNLF